MTLLIFTALLSRSGSCLFGFLCFFHIALPNFSAEHQLCIFAPVCEFTTWLRSHNSLESIFGFKLPVLRGWNFLCADVSTCLSSTAHFAVQIPISRQVLLFHWHRGRLCFATSRCFGFQLSHTARVIITFQCQFRAHFQVNCHISSRLLAKQFPAYICLYVYGICARGGLTFESLRRYRKMGFRSQKSPPPTPQRQYGNRQGEIQWLEEERIRALIWYTLVVLAPPPMSS